MAVQFPCLTIHPERVLFRRDPMLYGHFLEHFHRQIYGGVFDPASPLSDEDGFRMDVLEALRAIRTPVIRWPGGCFVSSYHWARGVGASREPVFDKAWRVEDSNRFGTDEFVKLCRKLGCEPYICTNAGTGSAEEMSDWLEYCNLADQGRFARLRASNGYPQPHGVRYWSIGNENYGDWEIGRKSSAEWAAFATEAAKMMRHVDPTIKLSAAALTDVEWNTRLLEQCGNRLDMLSIHGYWDFPGPNNKLSSYADCMGYTEELDAPVRRVRGLIEAFGLEKRIKIAFDEWNLRGWYHPKVHTLEQGVTEAEYLLPRDRNDDNASYTMADAVFSACFLNMLLRNGDVVRMANFAPVVNTRGAIFTHARGIVKRTTYYVFEMFANLMDDEVLDCWHQEPSPFVDAVATKNSADGTLAIALVNKHETEAQDIRLALPARGDATVRTLCGRSPDDYNDIGRSFAVPFDNDEAILAQSGDALLVRIPAHSVNILRLTSGS